MMAARRQTPDYARRGVYVDHTERYAWNVDSMGRKSFPVPVMSAEHRAAVIADLFADLDARDAVPADAFIAAPPPRQLRLLK